MATSPDRRPISICLSGGGFRATCFGAGALLAILGSTARDRIRSVSSVSGGSVASALFLGAAGDETDLRHRARLVGGLVTGDHIGTQARLRSLKVPLAGRPRIGGGRDLRAARHRPRVRGDLPLVGGLLRDRRADRRRRRGVGERVRGPVGDRGAGAERAQAPHGGAIRHVFCATDLGSGEHAYLADQQMLRVQGVSALRAVPVADTVAASAGFPGFRPVILGPHQVAGLSAGPRAPVGPVARVLIAALGLLAAAGVLTITVARMLDALSGTRGLLIWTVGVLAGSALAVGCALLLRTQANFVYLVDGGVCDNLGPAFAYLTRDDRYAGLEELLYGPTGPDDGPETLLIVVDASKSVDTNYFARTLSPPAALIPLRFRILMRSGVQLVASSNSSARRRAVQTLIDIDETVDGSILSLSELPDGPLPDGRDWTAGGSREPRRADHPVEDRRPHRERPDDARLRADGRLPHLAGHDGPATRAGVLRGPDRHRGPGGHHVRHRPPPAGPVRSPSGPTEPALLDPVRRWSRWATCWSSVGSSSRRCPVSRAGSPLSHFPVAVPRYFLGTVRLSTYTWEPTAPARAK